MKAFCLRQHRLTRKPAANARGLAI
jgi:hypothetical protein